MTQRYSHLSPAALVDTVRLLEPRLEVTDQGEAAKAANGS